MKKEYKIYFKYLLKRCNENNHFNNILNEGLDFNAKNFLKASIISEIIDSDKYQELGNNIEKAFYEINGCETCLLDLHTRLFQLSDIGASAEFNDLMRAEIGFLKIQEFLGLKAEHSTLFKNNNVFDLFIEAFDVDIKV